MCKKSNATAPAEGKKFQMYFGCSGGISNALESVQEVLQYMDDPKKNGTHALMLSRQERRAVYQTFKSALKQKKSDDNAKFLEVYDKLFDAFNKLDKEIGRNKKLEEKIEALKEESMRQTIGMDDELYQIFVKNNPEFFE